MKILVLHNILWAHYKSVLFEEIQKQIKPEDEFHVLQIAKNEISRKNMEGENMEYFYNYTLLFDDYKENIPKLKEIISVLKFIYKYNPDVLNVTGYSASASTLPAIFFAKLLGKKVVISNESSAFDKPRFGIKEIIKKAAIKVADGFVVFGKSSEKYILNLGAKPEQILVNKAAVVDNNTILKIYEKSKLLDCFPIIKTLRNFIFVGRIAPEKNVSLLIEAFQAIKKENWGLIIVGSGSDDHNVAQQITLDDTNIYRYSSVGWKEIPAFFSKADCLVLPSSSEPWGLVVNEAMVCGLSVIVTDVCGCAEDLVKENGYIIQPNNIEELKLAMIKIMSNNNLENMKIQSKRIIEEFSVISVAKNYLDTVKSLYK